MHANYESAYILPFKIAKGIYNSNFSLKIHGALTTRERTRIHSYRIRIKRYQKVSVLNQSISLSVGLSINLEVLGFISDHQMLFVLSNALSKNQLKTSSIVLQWKDHWVLSCTDLSLIS